MALETLLHNQQVAAELMNVDYSEVAEIQKPRLVMEGTIEVEGRETPVFRAHSGPEDNAAGEKLAGKGGIRMAKYSTREAAVGTVEELSVEMLAKLALRGRSDEFRGAKGLIVVDARSIGHAAKNGAARKYEHWMERADQAGYEKDVPAGDVGTNGLADAYALEYRKRNPEDPNWQASITGKSPENGGLKFRTRATGHGVYVTQQTVMKANNQEHARTTVQGFGNVGAWYGYYASNDPESMATVQGYSDVDGTIVTDDPEGFHVTKKMVETIGDNLLFEGPKIHALAEAISRNQRGLKFELRSNSKDIISYPTDHFIPAAMGNVLTGANIHTLGAKDAVFEGANGPTMPEAHQYMIEHGITNMPDITTNGEGVDCSIIERAANIKGIVPATIEVQRELTQTTERVVRDVLYAAENLNTRDLGVASAAVSMARLLQNERPHILSELLAD